MAVDNVCTSSNTDIDFCFPPAARQERSKCTICILQQWLVKSESDAALLQTAKHPHQKNTKDGGYNRLSG